MRRLKYALTILLVIAFVAVGGFLPHISTMVADNISCNQVTHQQIVPLELKTEDIEITGTSSIMKKLSLLRNGGQIVYINDALMHTPTEQATQAVNDALTRFSEAGLLPSTSNPEVVYERPCLIYDANGKNFSRFWEIEIRFHVSSDGIWRALCILDDDTQKVLSFTRITLYNCPMYKVSPEILEQFADFHFEQLGIKPQKVDGERNFICYIMEDAVYDRFTFTFSHFKENVIEAYIYD